MWDISFYKTHEYIFVMMQTLQLYCKHTLFIEQNNLHPTVRPSEVHL
jgi:hypothetical protein